MSSAALKTLKDILKRGPEGGAYYICGEDEFQKEDATKEIVTSALDPAVRDFNLDILRGADIDAKNFEGIVSSMPMMADQRVVVIRDVSGLKKSARKAVERFLKNPLDVLLVLVETAGAKTDKDLAKLTTSLEFDPLSAEEIPRWIADRATRDFRVQISSAAIDLLQSAVGNDLRQIVTELDKLTSFTGGAAITEDSVASVIGVHRGETTVDLLDAIGRRDTARALGLMEHILGQPKTTGVSILMLLSVQITAIAWGRARLDEGLPAGRLQGEYFNLLKQSGSIYLGRSWSSAAAAWASMVNFWDRNSLERATDALLTADLALKETRFSSEQQILTTLILSMCAGDERRFAA